MTAKMCLTLTIMAFVIVIAQPVFGWRSIPAFFNHAPAWAIVVGLIDGALLIAPSIIFLWPRI